MRVLNAAVEKRGADERLNEDEIISAVFRLNKLRETVEELELSQ